MPATRQQRLRTLARTWVPWRKLFGNRTVKRTVQGVELYMPWSHVLPDYARARPTYGQNLVELAAALAARELPGSGPLRMLDIGANIGDSALQILNRIDARVLCVEADPYWLRFLHLNADPEERIAIEEVLLVADDDEGGSVKAVRGIGTTTFEPTADTDGSVGRLSVGALRERHLDFAELRLIKSDTDGFDPGLVPATARAWRSSGPVLFFEFDPRLARGVGNDDPHGLWRELAVLGYDRLAIWDNTGDPLGQLGLGQAAEEAARLEPPPIELGYHFWDVAACRADDRAALEAFQEVMPEAFDRRGHRTSAH
jgi:FkbM family methyltransferase